jgi:hypothetical protein
MGMRFFLSLFLGAILLFISIQAYRLYAQRHTYEKALEANALEAAQLSGENEAYRHDIEFNERDENLIKEAQTKYNVKKGGEKMFILIPPKNASSN